jgi:hypothetical protein
VCVDPSTAIGIVMRWDVEPLAYGYLRVTDELDDEEMRQLEYGGSTASFMSDSEMATVGQPELLAWPDSHNPQTASSADLPTETGAISRETLIRSLALTFAGHGSSRRVMVGVAGFEPTAPRSQSECATKLRHTPFAPSGAPAQRTRPPEPTVDPPHTSAAKLAAGRLGRLRYGGACGRSSMVEPQPSKLAMPVRSRSPAPPTKPLRRSSEA